MSRRRKSASSAKKSSENATDQESDEWSEEEKKRLLDALKRDDGENNWRWITRQVNSKTMNQVKEFAEKLKAEKQTATGRRTSSSSKRPIAPKDTGPLEGWINATKRLRGDSDVDGTCIPQQTQTSREEECQDLDSGSENAPTSTHEELHCNGDRNEEEQQQVPELTSNSDHHKNTLSPNSVTEEQFQRTNSLMEDLLNNQKEMMQKISLLESMLVDLRSDGTSTQSSLMDMLTKITSKLDGLSNNAPHECCGGPVIIQTTPHANLIHQPVLGSCSSCRDGKQDKRHESSMPVSDKESSTINEKNDTTSTVSLRRTSVQTSSNSQSISSRKSSSESCTANLVIDTHKDSLPQSQEIQSSTSLPEITLCSASAPITADSSVSTSNCGSSINVSSESPTKVITPIPPKEHLPERCEEKSLRQEPCLPVVVECHSLSNKTSSVASVINLSPGIAVTAIANSVQTTVVSMASSQQRGPMSEQLNVTAPQQTYVTPRRDTFTSVQTTVSSLPPSYIDLHNTLTASPVLSTVARSPGARFVPGNNSQVVSSHLPQHVSSVPNISIPVIPLLSSQNRHLPRQPVQSITPTSAQTSTPPGYITLSHTTNGKPSTSKDYGVPLSLPQAQTNETTLRNPSGKAKDLDAWSAAESVIRRATIEACGKQRMDAASPKELLNAAMLISNYVTDHPNSKHQDQWQSCLSAIVTDYHKNLDPSKADSLQLVSIGYNPYVVLPQYELEDMLEKSKGRPKYFALRLAEKLFGIDVLIKSTPYGIGGKAALHPVILDAIKVEVLRRFASDMSSEGQIAFWKSCVTSIAQRCKRARNPRKDRSLTRASANSVDVGLPSMAVGGGIQLSEHDENDDSQEELDDEDDDCDMSSLDQSAARCTPPLDLIRIPSDDEKTPTKNGIEEGDYNDAGCVTPIKDSTARPESVADSSMEKRDGTEGERSIPPGIDPDITVVHLPSNLQTSVEPQVKSTTQRQSSVVVTTRHAATSSGNRVSVSGEESIRMDRQQSVSGREGDNNDESKEKGSPLAGNSSGNSMVQSFPNPNASIESVTVSGIRMTADYFHVLVGGNPNVVIPRQKYLDAVTKSSQPTHFAVRLAELVFGDDVLEASTVTGGKRGTMQLDPIMIKAIQMEVTERFLKTLDPEQQNVVWRKCVTSIATRCKTLRYNRAKIAENQWTLVHPNQIMTIAAMEPVQSEPGNPAPDYSQIYTLLSRVMREQPPPDLTPLDASVILDLLNDLERRLAGHDISSQVQFVVNKSKEIMATAARTTGQGSSDVGSSSSRPKSQLFSLNPLNVPVQLLNLKKPAPVNTASQAAPGNIKEQS